MCRVVWRHCCLSHVTADRKREPDLAQRTFDDVIRITESDLDTSKPPKIELDHEKSQVGLAELYEKTVRRVHMLLGLRVSCVCLVCVFWCVCFGVCVLCVCVW